MTRRSTIVLLIPLFVLACATEPNQPAQNEGGVSLLWGGLSPTCISSDSLNKGNEDEVPILQFDDGPPSDIDRLVVRLTGENCKEGVGNGQICTQELAFPLDDIKLTSSGILEVKGVDPDIPQTLRLFGCNGSEAAPRWSGTTFGVVVEEHTKETVFILMTPESQLSCPTDSVQVGDATIGSSSPFAAGNSAFSAMATMNNGDVVLLGGIGTDLEATDGISLLDAETGSWVEREGSLSVPRGMASTYVLDARNVLVFGGTSKLEIKRARAEPPFLFPGSGSSEFSSDDFVEIVDVVAGSSTTLPLPGASSAGLASFAAMSSSLYVPAQDNILVVGGVRGDVAAKDFADADSLSDVAVRIHGVTSPSPSVTVLTMATARIGAALLPTADGHLIVFGGNYDGQNNHLVEWIGKDWQSSAVIPSEDIIFNNGLDASSVQSVGFASTMLVKDDPNDRTWLILGGHASFGGGYTNQIDQGQILTVNVVSGSTDAPEVTIGTVTSTDVNLATRAFTHLSKTLNGRLLLVGGVASVSPINLGDECSAVEGQCLRKNATIMRYDAAARTLTVEDEIEIGAALGVSASTRADETFAFSPGLNNIKINEVAVGLPSLIWNPLSASDAALCKSSIPTGE